MSNEKNYAMEAFRQIQNETKKTCINLELIDTKPSVTESKVGGIGYIPREGNFPVNSKGEQLRLLAQINCSDVNLDNFPEKGLLQFWIMNDDLSGADFDNNTKQENFRIVYHENADMTVTEEEIKAKIVPNENERDGAENFMPVTGEYGIKFTVSESFLPVFDYKFDEVFCKRYNALNPDHQIESYYELDEEIDEIYDESSESAFGHKIGGYPAFTQEDPREVLPKDEAGNYNFLLLQLDSEFGGGIDKIMWGDAGICNFFINSEKLKALDFSDVIYNWDCS